MNVWVPVLLSGLALVPGLYAAYNTWSNKAADRNNVVFQNAMALIEANRRQAEENGKQADRLKKQLYAANKTIEDITTKLFAANKRADKLALDLADANTEIATLRSQIKTMSQQVDGETNGRS